jgi:group II intron reverse transcriptase/maturase
MKIEVRKTLLTWTRRSQGVRNLARRDFFMNSCEAVAKRTAGGMAGRGRFAGAGKSYGDATALKAADKTGMVGSMLDMRTFNTIDVGGREKHESEALGHGRPPVQFVGGWGVLKPSCHSPNLVGQIVTLRSPQVAARPGMLANKGNAITAMYNKLCEIDRLQAAWVRVRQNGAATGGDGETAFSFAARLNDRLAQLSDDLLGGRYRPGPLREVPMRRPDGRIRLLRIPGLADRVVQTACQKLLSEHLDPRMSSESFGYRPARSVEQALARLRSLSCNQAWVCDADIEAYFDRVPHERLLDDLGIWLMDERICTLVDLWLRRFGSGRGLAQGAPISPILANLYLHPLDMALVRARIPFVRYADDFVALAKDRAGAARAMAIVAGVLHRRGLALHPGKTRILRLADGLDFLGQQLTFPAAQPDSKFVKPRTNRFLR